MDAGERTVELRGAVHAVTVGLAPGAVLAGRYQIEASIGEGGSGQVFRAWDRVLGEPIALKILRADRAREKDWIRRLAREVKVARAIRHPNVCRVFDLGCADGHWFISMELAPRGPLRDSLRAGDARSLEARIADLRAICAGLAAIHAVGITHRDVTPHNVLRMEDGRLVISDFGLSVDDAESTLDGGTPSYMPPESVMGARADQRSDVWQLGLIMHELVFGRRAEWTTGPEVMRPRMPVGAGASPLEAQLARLCCDCLAPNPAERPASAIVVVGRLAAAEHARPPATWERATGWLRELAGRSRRAALAVALTLSVAAATAVATRRLLRAPASAASVRWDAATRENVRRALLETRDPAAQQTFEKLDALLSGKPAAR